MNPYLHAVSVRGESFRCDDIVNLDQFAAEQAKIQIILDQTKKASPIRNYIRKLPTILSKPFKQSKE